MLPPSTTVLLFLLYPLATVPSSAPSSIYSSPQYLALNFDFDPGYPSSFSQQTITNMLQALNQTRGSRKRVLAFSFDFWSLYDADIPTMINSTDALLQLVTDNDLPLSISIDATQWWQFRPDLFNWWNSSLPTFNPLNKYNVEWFGWSPDNATSVSWRNWGSQFRMPSPAPNFASPAYQRAAAESMMPIASRIALWYRQLPPNKKYLLGYIRCVQELWIGTNYFYYPGGNYPNGTPGWDPAHDPTGGLPNTTQLGYAAICTSGLACNGTITTAQLDTIVSSLITFTGQVLLDAGIPRSRIMSHTGFFNDPPTDTLVFNSAAAAVTTMAAPGWSLYNQATLNMSNNIGVPEALESIANTPWGAPEFNPYLGSNGTLEGWTAAFLNTFSYKNNRLLVLQNWGSIYPSNPVGQQGVVNALLDIPDCLVDSANYFGSTLLNSTFVLLQFTLGSDTDSAVLNIGIINNVFLPSGELAATLLSIPLTNTATEYTLNLMDVGNGTVPIYWQITSNGCTSQSIVSEVQILDTVA